MRAGVPCFSAAQHEEAEAKLIKHAEEIGAPLYLSGRDFFVTPKGNGVHVSFKGREVTLPELGLKGPHQRDNAGLAAVAVMSAFPEINDKALMTGAAKAVWPGRVQHLETGLLAEQSAPIPLWLDGAHNAHGAEALAATLPELHDGPWVLLCGALNTRDPKDFLTPLKDKVSAAFTITIPGQDAALPAEEIAQSALSLGLNARAYDTVENAFHDAINAAKEIDGAIIIAGSLYLAGHILGLNGTLPE